MRNETAMFVSVDRDIRERKYKVYLHRRDEGVDRFLLPGQWIEIDPGVEQQPCAAALSYELGQGLLDELWNLGLRPSRELSNTGEKEAMRAHIVSLQAEVDFLRVVVNHQLGRPV